MLAASQCRCRRSQRCRPWAFEGNRPFLCALYGCALCLWHEDRFEEAEEPLRELLEFDPTDGLGAQAALALVSKDTPWSARFMPAAC